eukprot:TRINITY_DN5336_c0_g1_i4.p2 TRINITY_DN5336_c0_g1~~TRINITY_DN5336_c0_g1_i4.p2  ORF type:complete len:176 (+),score=25.18 TRINITY_DN5336_c0_g1_i4:121-648(+)
MSSIKKQETIQKDVKDQIPELDYPLSYRSPEKLVSRVWEEQIPVEKSYIKYVPEYRVEYVPVEQRYTDYKVYKHVIEQIPVPRVEYDYIPEEKTYYVGEKSGSVVEERPRYSDSYNYRYPSSYYYPYSSNYSPYYYPSDYYWKYSTPISYQRYLDFKYNSPSRYYYDSYTTRKYL